MAGAAQIVYVGGKITARVYNTKKGKKMEKTIDLKNGINLVIVTSNENHHDDDPLHELKQLSRYVSNLADRIERLEKRHDRP